MSESLRAQERLHNALVRLEHKVQQCIETNATQQGVYSASEEIDALRRENIKLKEKQENAKLRLDTLIETIESEIKD